MAKTKPIGTIHGKYAMFLRVHVGKGSHPDFGSFELSANAGGYMPMVRSDKTGKTFILSWSDIVNLAEKAGVFKE